jgi:predicted dithiol-disulfide oxidoreductase (DUF899 family)
MFGPSYAAGCPTCSSIADSVNGVLPHLNARDVTMLFVSQAPLETLWLRLTLAPASTLTGFRAWALNIRT